MLLARLISFHKLSLYLWISILSISSVKVKSHQGEVCSIDGRIRLNGGTTGFDGRLEICNNHTWSTVCLRGQYGNHSLASVVCRQLGLARSLIPGPGDALTVIQPMDKLWTFGMSSGPIIWSQVNCVGTESSIFDCSYRLDVSGCTHDLDVGISCTTNDCTTGLVHLRQGNNVNTIQGTVSLCVTRIAAGTLTASQVWVNICDIHWDISEAIVVCRQLGLPTENANVRSLGGGLHSIHEKNVVLCSGTEPDLLQCTFDRQNNLETACNNRSYDAGVICGDPNECNLGTHNCDRNAFCIDMDNGFECHCMEPLYVGNGIACSKANLCANTSTHNCSIENNEVCIGTDTLPGFRCECRTGFNNETGICREVNECVKSPHITNCTHRCVNTEGSFYCECHSGYSLLENGYECKDINECIDGTNGCEQVCNNTESSYICGCYNGYSLAEDGHSCVDIDECADSSNNCTHICNNTMGSYLCDCLNGYLLLADFSTCQDVDECTNPEANQCNTSSTCSNTQGSYECVCSFPWNEPVDNFSCRLSTVFLGSIIAGVIGLTVTLFMGIFIICFCSFKKMKSNIKNDQTKQTTLNDHVSNIADSIVLQSKHGLKISVSSDVGLPPETLISSNRLKLLETIGQGEFGLVYKGKLKYGQAMTELVAVKTLKGLYDQTSVDKLLEECVKMAGLDHPNILTLKGVCLDGGPAPFIILPFMKNGSLLSFLQREKDKLFLTFEEICEEEIQSVTKQLMDMSLQIARGMEFLARKKLIHRDLAARNCMIDTHFTIKVADFGLTVNTGSEADYFRLSKESGERLPVKWMAPESMVDFKFSEKSDIWAFGVTTWEIFSGGQAPYPSIKPMELKDLLIVGHRMEKPQNLACNEKIYDMMLSCWNLEPSDRPTFSKVVTDLSTSLEAMAGYMNVDILVTTKIDSDSESGSHTDSVFN